MSTTVVGTKVKQGTKRQGIQTGREEGNPSLTNKAQNIAMRPKEKQHTDKQAAIYPPSFSPP
jgi:hypothetical protein